MNECLGIDLFGNKSVSKILAEESMMFTIPVGWNINFKIRSKNIKAIDCLYVSLLYFSHGHDAYATFVSKMSRVYALRTSLLCLLEHILVFTSNGTHARSSHIDTLAHKLFARPIAHE